MDNDFPLPKVGQQFLGVHCAPRATLTVLLVSSTHVYWRSEWSYIGVDFSVEIGCTHESYRQQRRLAFITPFVED